MPQSVKEQIQAELYDWAGTGCSVMEVSHRSKEFMAMTDENESLAREILNISDDYAFMLIPGGARMQYAMLPMNISSAQGKAVYCINGHWGKLALKEGARFCEAKSTHKILETTYDHIPTITSDQINSDCDYFHYTSNETLEGVQWNHVPDTNGIPICCDMTSDLLTEEIDVNKFDMIYASAQKNMGIAGISCVIMKRSLIGQSVNNLPTMLDYDTYARTRSAYNTPPTFPWYVMLLVLRWVKEQGGLKVIGQRNLVKSEKLYNYIDGSGFYFNKVKADFRSKVNVPFWLENEDLGELFLQSSSTADLKALKGHKAVGGMRASIYNAMSEEGIDMLIEFMREFERTHG